MEANEYQKLAMRTNDGRATDRLLQKIIKVNKDEPDYGGIMNSWRALTRNRKAVCNEPRSNIGQSPYRDLDRGRAEELRPRTGHHRNLHA